MSDPDSPVKRRVHYVLGTHWDREWRGSFQELRFDLVRLLDRVLDGFESGRLQTPFVTDGQSSVIVDYLEVRPERRPVVERLAREGKLVIGPWYTMPDEFLVSGESLVRNLRLGRETAASFGGEPSAAGLVCDMFGHISQLPQIFAGAGIRGAFIWRGVNLSGRRSLIWRGADGTRLVCHRFGPRGYGTYALAVRGGFDYERRPEDFRRFLDAYLQKEAAATQVGPILIFDSSDHQQWDEEAYERMLGHMDELGREFELVPSTLDRYLDEMIADPSSIDLVVEGELREPGYEPFRRQTRTLDGDEQWLIPGVLSSRAYLKQANGQCETLLCHWAEPFALYAGASLRVSYPPGLFDVAWRLLLENHAHDSIGGCSVDQVHRDMEFRFDQARLIAEKVTSDATHRIAASAGGKVADDEVRIALFNPLPQRRREIVEFDVELPLGWADFEEFFGYEPKPAFRLYDPQGDEIAYQRVGQDMNLLRARIRPTHLPETVRFNRVRVAAELELPACGYTTISARAQSPDAPFVRHPQLPGLATSERSMNNGLVDVVIEMNGTLSLTDLRTGERYERLLTFEDCADIGDGWYHGPPANDATFVSTAAAADIVLLFDSSLLTRFQIRTLMRLPEAWDGPGMRRSGHLVELAVSSTVTLRAGRAIVELETNLVNVVDDHRLRVLFPTGAQAETYLADSAFDVVERPIALRADNHLYRELETETKPQRSWTAVCDGGRGLAIVTTGLHETAVRDFPERPIALTLFRSTRKTVLTNGEPDGELRRSLCFRYWIAPIEKSIDRASLCRLGQELAAGIRTVTLWRADQDTFREGMALPPEQSFLEVDGDVVVTSTRQVSATIEVRLFNPNVTEAEARVTLHLEPSGSGALCAYSTNLLGEPESELEDAADGVAVALAAKKIRTLVFVTKEN